MHPLFPYLLGFMLCVGVPRSAPAQSIHYNIYDSISQLEARIRQSNNTTLVVNFWATWCGPCVAELPYFEQLNKQYAGKNVEVLLVSLDFKSQVEQKLNPFLEKNQLHSEVCLLADQDADNWIPRIQSNWDGAIPFTIVIKGSKTGVHFERFKSYEDLDAFVRPLAESAGTGSTASRK